MLVDGILSVRLLCAEMRRQLRSWALCEAGSAESADYLVALHVYLRVCIVRRLSRRPEGGGGACVGLQRAYTVRAEGTGDLRDLATRNAKMSHCGGDSWLQWSQYKLLPTGGWAVDLVRARVSPSGRLVRAAGLPLFRMAVIFLLLGRRGTRGSAAFAETAGVARWACILGGAFDEGWSLWTFVCVSLRDVNARAHRRWAEINDG